MQPSNARRGRANKQAAVALRHSNWPKVFSIKLCFVSAAAALPLPLQLSTGRKWLFHFPLALSRRPNNPLFLSPAALACLGQNKRKRAPINGNKSCSGARSNQDNERALEAQSWLASRLLGCLSDWPCSLLIGLFAFYLFLFFDNAVTIQEALACSFACLALCSCSLVSQRNPIQRAEAKRERRE